MSNSIATGSVHHLTLTVCNVQQSLQFYTGVMGFLFVMDIGPRKLLSNGSVALVLAPPPDPSQAISDDQFNENRVGLDHVSFNVAGRGELEAALRLLDQSGVSHGEIKDLGPALGIYVLAFRDSDNIQLELTAPYA